MPGTNAGTGNPLTFRCSKCKNGDFTDRHRGTNWRATGKRRESFNGSGGPRIDHQYKYGYECLDCGFIGWSRHSSVKSAWTVEHGSVHSIPA